MSSGIEDFLSNCVEKVREGVDYVTGAYISMGPLTKTVAGVALIGTGMLFDYKIVDDILKVGGAALLGSAVKENIGPVSDRKVGYAIAAGSAALAAIGLGFDYGVLDDIFKVAGTAAAVTFLPPRRKEKPSEYDGARKI